MSDIQKTKQFQYFPGHMKKALNKIDELCKLAQGAIIVLDGRAPISSFPAQLAETLNKNNIKNLIYVLSHEDLVNTDKVEKYILENQTSDKRIFLLNLNQKQSCEKLLKYLEQIKGVDDNKYLKYNFPLPIIDFLIVGIPNVGKSTLINNLKNKKVAQVENRPGKTRALTLFKVNKRVEVIDTPGILEPNYQDKNVIKKLSLLGSVNLDAIPFDELFDYLYTLLSTEHYNNVLTRYSIDSFTSISELIEKVGYSKLILTKGGIPDVDLIKQIIFKDFQRGLLGKVYLD